jgi:acyl carrier protein
MLDHVINGTALLPGTAHIEMGRALAGLLANEVHGEVSLGSLSFIAPLVLEAKTTVACEVDGHGNISVGVASKTTHHATGLGIRSKARVHKICACALPSLSSDSTSGKGLQVSLPGAKQNYVYSQLYTMREVPYSYYACPAMLDGAFQSSVGATSVGITAVEDMKGSESEQTSNRAIREGSAQNANARVPACISNVSMHGGITTAMHGFASALIFEECAPTTTHSAVQSSHELWHLDVRRGIIHTHVFLLEGRIIQKVPTGNFESLSTPIYYQHGGSMEGRYSRTHREIYEGLSRAELGIQISSLLRGILECEIIEDVPLVEQGLDSLGAMELARVLTEMTKIKVHVETLQDNPTLKSLTTFIENEITLGMSTDPSTEKNSKEYGESINRAERKYPRSPRSEKETKARTLLYKYMQVVPWLVLFVFICIFSRLEGEFFDL